MIFDPLRRRNVPDTPEERVRQSVIRWLHESKGISKELMASEYGFRYNGRQYRADIVVFDRNLHPDTLVECKAPDVPLTDAVFEQAIRYNRVLDVRRIILCNGKQMRIWKKEGDTERKNNN